MARPALPFKYANPTLNGIPSAHLPPVKYQILSCQGKDILVGRLKIDTTDGGHAFILRRFDTNAVSLTTMFRAAFPKSSDMDEKNEINWVKENYNLFGNNGSSKEPHLTRLAGVWVDCETALKLGAEYNMAELIQVIVNATPDPNGQYRRSNKSTQPPADQPQPAATATPSKVNGTPTKHSTPKPPSKTLPTPSPGSGDVQPPVTKRRREASPAFSIPTPAHPTPIAPKTPLPRRSTRTKSPAPSRVPQPFTSTKPRSRASAQPPSPKKKVAELPKVSPIKNTEDAAVEEGVAGSELYEQDIQEQKKLIADLKAAASSKSIPEVEEDEAMTEEQQGPSKLKRARQDEQETLQFNFKEPEQEERQVATNRRVSRFQMQPQTKSVAWGLAAFAVGMSAITFLPNFF